MSTSVRVLLFARAREAVGVGRIDRPVPPAGSSVDELVTALAREHPRLAPVLASSRFFVNDEVVSRSRARVRPGDELAIHPPYSGG